MTNCKGNAIHLEWSLLPALQVLEQNRRRQAQNNAPQDFPSFARQGFDIKILADGYSTSNGLIYKVRTALRQQQQTAASRHGGFEACCELLIGHTCPSDVLAIKHKAVQGFEIYILSLRETVSCDSLSLCNASKPPCCLRVPIRILGLHQCELPLQL